MGEVELQWEEPPNVQRPSRGISGEWQRVAAELRANPGCWAVVASGDPSESRRLSCVAANIKFARLRAFAPLGAFEAMLRTVDGVSNVYARAVPESTDG